MRNACPSVFARFYPRAIRNHLGSKSFRSFLVVVLCVGVGVGTAPFATSAFAQETAPPPSDQSSWLPPEPPETKDGEYAALVPPAPSNWLSPSSEPKKTIGGFRNHIEAGAITLRSSTPTNCLPGDLKTVLADVASRFGTVSVQSTHRSPQHNRRAGGAGRSLHLDCRAIDFRVKARGREVISFLREHKSVGGLKMYRNGIIHIDNGERRSW
jgi:hypothetical protein